MKVTMVAVSSLNGKITKVDDLNIYSWTSKEDSNFFFSQIKKNNLIVMGSKTYEASRKVIKLQKNKLRIVLTKNPKTYLAETRNGILEFTDDNPLKLIRKLEDRGYKKMLLVGGGTINSVFLKSKSVDEIYLTIEPKIFGTGKNLIADEDLGVSLKLMNIRKLNKQGTLLLKYKILN